MNRLSRQMKNIAGALALVGLVGLGAGCSDSGDPEAKEAAYCQMPDPGTLDFIDDMEDGNADILGRDGRVSQWYTYNDGTEGILQPVPNAAPAMEAIPGGRCTFSTKGMRVTGSGFSKWGSGFGFDFHTVFGASGYEAGTYDGSAARGITFWARVGDPSVTTLWFGVGDQWSIPSGGHCDVTIETGPTACYDVYGTTLELTTEWKRYAVSWGQLGQRSFGLPRPELDVAHLYNAHFDMPASATVFDIWIDDIAFYK